MTQEIGGRVARGFEPVLEEFARNFSERGERGAAFAAVRGDEALVDIWGGVADHNTGRPWTADTLQILFSGTKGFVAACMLLLIERRKLDLDTPVAHYWPEFAAAGKGDVLVRDVVAHTVGLPGLSEPVTWLQATDAQHMASLLAQQPRSRDPRAASTYHAVTYGWLCGELVRRVSGCDIGQFLAMNIAVPLNLEIWIGLPAHLEPRVSAVELAATWTDVPSSTALDPLRRAIENPRRYDAESFPWNEPRWHAAQVPSSNGIASARAVAGFYSGLGRVMAPETLRLGSNPLSTRYDPILARQTCFGVGFQLQTDDRPLGPPPDAFGHGGAGGSVHGWWPGYRVGFSYAMNLLRNDAEDTRGKALLESLHHCLEKEA